MARPLFTYETADFSALVIIIGVGLLILMWTALKNHWNSEH